MNDLSSFSDSQLEEMLKQQHSEIVGGSSPQKGPGALGLASTAAAGFNKGILANIAGLPVDTIQNLIDMGKGVLSLAPGQRNNPAFEINQDRSSTVGSSDWLAKKINQVGAGDVINNRYENDQTARNLYAAGQGVSGLVTGGSSTGPQLAKNAALMALSGAAGNATAEATGNPALAAIASLSPQAALSSANATAKYSIRRGEEGRQNIITNRQIFDNAGAGSPTVAQATQGGPGGTQNQIAETFLSRSPFSYGTFQNKANDLLQRLHGGINEQIANSGGQVTPVTTGKDIQGDIRQFKNQRMQTYGNLEEGAANKMPYDYGIQPSATMATLDKLLLPTPMSPNTNAAVQPGLGNLRDAIFLDSKGVAVPKGTDTLRPTPALAPNLPFSMADVGYENGNKYNWRDLRTLKSMVGEKAFPEGLSILPPNEGQGQYRQLYGAIKQDLSAGAEQYNPEVKAAIDRANKYYTALMGSSSQSNPVVGRLQNLDSMIGKTSPEDVFYSIERSLNGKNPDLTTFNAIKKSIQPEQRSAVATTVIDRLGRSSPGQQSADNTAWDINRFLTNYSNLQPSARDALFSGFKNAETMRSKIDSIAKVADNIKSGSKVFANPSGTGAFLSAEHSLLGTAGGAITAAMSGNPLLAAGIASIPPSIYGAGRLATSKDFVDWLSRQSSPSDAKKMQNLLQMQNSLIAAQQGQKQEE